MAVNGCCYGRERFPDKGDYRKYCGQSFWEFISGSRTLYTDIIEPLGHRAKERNDDFAARYAEVWNRFTQEFMAAYCIEGRLQWDAIVRLNSSNEKPKRTPAKAKTGKKRF